MIVLAALKAIWIWLKRAIAWISKHPVAIVSAIASGVGAYFIWRSSRNRIRSLEEAVEVQGAKAKIAKKESEARYLAKSGADHSVAAASINAEISRSKRRVVELNEGEPLEGKTDDEIARMFDKAGF